MKPLAVIILNWNGAKLLDNYLPSLIKYTPKHLARLIVADNGSNDVSLSLLESKYPEIEVISFPENHGFAEGYNLAIEAVDNPYICLLNSDVELMPDWYKAPMEALENEHVAAVQPKILAIKQPGHFEYAGAAGGFIDTFGYPFCRGRLFDTVERDDGQYNGDPINVFWASGACLFVRREAYLDVGGLDKRFFAHQEEIDLCWRLQQKGYLIQAVTKSTVLHLGGASLDMSDPHKTYLNFRNNLLMLYKNYPARGFRSLMFVRFLLDLVSVIQFGITGKAKYAKAVLKAMRDFYRMRHDFDTERQSARHTELTSLAVPPKPYSIVWKYFIQRRKHYSELQL